MSRNESALLAIVSTVGTQKLHAVSGQAQPSLRDLTYARPVCGMRGRDATGLATSKLISSDDGAEFVSFDTARGSKLYSEKKRTVCDRCARIADRVATGESIAEASAVYPPEINAKTREAIESSKSTPIELDVAEDKTVTDNLLGTSVRVVVALVKSSPITVEVEYNDEYRADVSYPATPDYVMLRLTTDESGETTVSSTVSLAYLHPKTMKPVTGTKLYRRGQRSGGAEVDQLRKLIGI